ncbi:hypothetical protein BC834DRAFT_828775, partial [Gloeopeniophorella convolvens]
CAICLGAHSDARSCTRPTLWSGGPARCRRTASGRIIDPNQVELCTDWQRPRGCRRSTHPDRHQCSGCGTGSHGASGCHLAEKV